MSDRSEAIRAVLRSTSLWTQVSDEVLDEIATRADEKHFTRGDYVCLDGDPGQTLFVIARGSVDVLKQVGERELLLSTLHAGELFGEMGLIDRSPRSASVRAASDCASPTWSAWRNCSRSTTNSPK